MVIFQFLIHYLDVEDSKYFKIEVQSNSHKIPQNRTKMKKKKPRGSFDCLIMLDNQAMKTGH